MFPMTGPQAEAFGNESVNTADLAFYKGANRVTEPGQFQVWIGPDSTAGVQSQFEIVP